MFAALDISASGLVAQQTRLTAVASNIANISSFRNEDGQPVPFHARIPILETDESLGGRHGAAGVRVAAVETERIDENDYLYKYDPRHPYAIKSGKRAGYVAYPKVNMLEQMVDAMQATRAYEANVGVMEMSKQIEQQTLRILV